MANQINAQTFCPLSLLSITASFIVRNDLQRSSKDGYTNSLVNSIILRKWKDLKDSSQNFGLAQIMSNIENSLIDSLQINRPLPVDSSEEEKEILLKNNVNTLFKNLAHRFHAENFYDKVIPVDPAPYARLQQAQQRFEDDALKRIWDFAISRSLQYDGPLLTSDAIKTWLENPANVNQLNAIRKLELQHLGLKVIPPHITKFAQLQRLFLNYNQIRSIPDSLGTLAQLKELSLQNNQISSIPDSLGKSPQLLRLYLNNNRISSIPDSLGNLTQLQVLALDHNRISSIPDSLSNLTRLTRLSLNHNQINSIPDSIGDLELEVLSLNHNQITCIPDSLSNLADQISFDDSFEIMSISFIGNPLLFISDKNQIHEHTGNLISKYAEFKEYFCLSSFSHFCQLIALNKNHKMVEEAFRQLKLQDQRLIFEMVYIESGAQSNDPKWGEHHVFDDMNIFYRAVRKAISAKFDRLSADEKNVVYGKIYRLAQPETEDAEWGKHHAFDHVLLLVDAMDKIALKLSF
jgi:hypothetical protein